MTNRPAPQHKALRQSQAMHLIIPYAALADMPADALKRLPLPHLRQLLSQMQCTQRDTDAQEDPPSPHMPHERAWARALGWPDTGAWPWAAQAYPEDSAPQAWLTPCHWQVGMDQVLMLDPSHLNLRDEESQQLLEAMQPYLKEDGLEVQWHSALRWHARGDIFKTMQPASLDRVIGANLKPWMGDAHLPAPLRRLQSEMQMLLYNHPVNDARMDKRQYTVNSFWVHGAGAPLPAPTPRPPSDVVVIDTLRAAALQGDWPSWQAAWLKLDAEHLGPLVDRADLHLTLCSARAAHTYQRRTPTWLQRLRAALQPTDTSQALLALIPK